MNASVLMGQYGSLWTPLVMQCQNCDKSGFCVKQFDHDNCGLIKFLIPVRDRYAIYKSTADSVCLFRPNGNVY